MPSYNDKRDVELRRPRFQIRRLAIFRDFDPEQHLKMKRETNPQGHMAKSLVLPLDSPLAIGKAVCRHGRYPVELLSRRKTRTHPILNTTFALQLQSKTGVFQK